MCIHANIRRLMPYPYTLFTYINTWSRECVKLPMALVGPHSTGRGDRYLAEVCQRCVAQHTCRHFMTSLHGTHVEQWLPKVSEQIQNVPTRPANIRDT